MHSRRLLYLQANTTALIFSIVGSSRDFCSNLLNVLLDYRFAFIQPFSPPPTVSKETFWNVNPIMLLLSLKAFWLLGLAHLLAFCFSLIFCPFHHSPCCSCPRVWGSVMICAFPHAAWNTWSNPGPTFPSQACPASLPPRSAWTLPGWVCWFLMLPHCSVYEVCQFRPPFPIWITDILFMLYPLFRHWSKLYRYYREQSTEFLCLWNTFYQREIRQ